MVAGYYSTDKHPKTREKVWDVLSIDLEIRVVMEKRAENSGLAVTWSDSHHSDFESGWLRRHSYSETTSRKLLPVPVLW